MKQALATIIERKYKDGTVIIYDDTELRRAVIGEFKELKAEEIVKFIDEMAESPKSE